MLHSLNYLHMKKLFFSLICYFYHSLYYLFCIGKNTRVATNGQSISVSTELDYPKEIKSNY